MTQIGKVIAPGATNATASILDASYNVDLQRLPADVVALVKQCWLDWIGVAVAGGREPLTDILTDEAMDRTEGGKLTLVGRTERASLADAVLINGAASHALDYDDGNIFFMGHPSVTLAPVLFSLAEHKASSGAAVIAAFLSGYETGCRIGSLVSPDHYLRGFHATATIGSFAATTAASHLLGLKKETVVMALGIAGTQAAGLKSAFGTMCKPLHAGRCSYNGLMSARMAERGFTATTDTLGAPQGFSKTHSSDFNLERALGTPGEFRIFKGRYKFHAACAGTHPTLDAAHELLKRHKIAPDAIESVTVRLPATSDSVCNQQEPTTGLGLKFSLRTLTALVLLGIDTSDIGIFTDATANDKKVVALRDRVAVSLERDHPHEVGDITVVLRDGQKLNHVLNSLADPMSIADQGARLAKKFRALVTPVIGAARAAEIEDKVNTLEKIKDFGEIARLARPAS